MSVVDSHPTAQRARGQYPPGPHGTGAKVRILETADRLFYAEGIRSVGVDKLITQAAVTKATFYKHYGAKDTLIRAYLDERHRGVERLVEENVAAAARPADAIRAIVEIVSADVHRTGFRGCPFMNAAAEFADPHHPVRQIVAAHRDWYTERITTLMRTAGHPMPGDAADDILLARDGAMTGGYAGDPVSASASLHRVVERLLSEATR